MSLVKQTRQMARELVDIESRGFGDTEHAMWRISERHNIPMNTLWRLRYRPPKKAILAEIYIKITEALQAERERQLGKLQNDIARTRTATGNRSPSLASIETLVRTQNLESPAHDRPIRTLNSRGTSEQSGL